LYWVTPFALNVFNDYRYTRTKQMIPFVGLCVVVSPILTGIIVATLMIGSADPLFIYGHTWMDMWGTMALCLNYVWKGWYICVCMGARALLKSLRMTRKLKWYLCFKNWRFWI